MRAGEKKTDEFGSMENEMGKTGTVLPLLEISTVLFSVAVVT